MLTFSGRWSLVLQMACPSLPVPSLTGSTLAAPLRQTYLVIISPRYLFPLESRSLTEPLHHTAELGVFLSHKILIPIYSLGFRKGGDFSEGDLARNWRIPPGGEIAGGKEGGGEERDQIGGREETRVCSL